MRQFTPNCLYQGSGGVPGCRRPSALRPSARRPSPVTTGADDEAHAAKGEYDVSLSVAISQPWFSITALSL